MQGWVLAVAPPSRNIVIDLSDLARVVLPDGPAIWAIPGCWHRCDYVSVEPRPMIPAAELPRSGHRKPQTLANYTYLVAYSQPTHRPMIPKTGYTCCQYNQYTSNSTRYLVLIVIVLTTAVVFWRDRNGLIAVVTKAPSTAIPDIGWLVGLVMYYTWSQI